MKRRLFLSALLLIVLLGYNIQSAFAQSYLFEVPVMDVVVTISDQGYADIDYILEFRNAKGAHEIDYIDLGLPNNNFSTSNITADVNGSPITDISTSGYQGTGTGVALGLGSNAIQPGQSGRVHVNISGVSGMLFPDDKDENYASFEFSPVWFGSEYVRGSTSLSVGFIFPAGLSTEEPRYHIPQNWIELNEPEMGVNPDGRIYYRWASENASASSQYTFGASFPKSLVPESAIAAAPVFNINFEDVLGFACCFGFFGIFALTFGFAIYQAIWGNRKRKLKYLPPKISVEGHGIKRGLTAVEAAILMEQPMDKIMTMVLFAVVKKGAAEVLSREPLKIKVAETLPEGLRQYETDFLKAFEKEKASEQRTLLQSMMVNLVKEVSEKMKGFSRKETIAYYESIMKEAWKQVEEAATPEVKVEKYDEVMDWTMLDRNYQDHTRDVFSSGPVFIPHWWGRYDPSFRTATQAGGSSVGAGPSTSGSGGQTISMPNLPGSAFAASVINGSQAFSAGVLGNVTNFTSGITNKTNPIPVSTSTTKSSGGRSWGGGGGCACACACAGCACACAGGGR